MSTMRLISSRVRPGLAACSLISMSSRSMCGPSVEVHELYHVDQLVQLLGDLLDDVGEPVVTRVMRDNGQDPPSARRSSDSML